MFECVTGRNHVGLLLDRIATHLERGIGRLFNATFGLVGRLIRWAGRSVARTYTSVYSTSIQRGHRTVTSVLFAVLAAILVALLII